MLSTADSPHRGAPSGSPCPISCAPATEKVCSIGGDRVGSAFLAIELRQPGPGRAAPTRCCRQIAADFAVSVGVARHGDHRLQRRPTGLTSALHSAPIADRLRQIPRGGAGLRPLRAVRGGLRPDAARWKPRRWRVRFFSGPHGRLDPRRSASPISATWCPTSSASRCWAGFLAGNVLRANCSARPRAA